MPQKLKEVKAKAGRRGNNEGSIYQRKDGRWCGAVTTGYDTKGKQKRKTVYGKSRQEVARKIAEEVAKVLNYGYSKVAPTTERNFEALCKEWFDLFVAGTTGSVTETNRRYLLLCHIFPAFGKYDIQDVTVERLQRFFNDKVQHYAPDTVHKMKNLLNNFFKYAKPKYVLDNPVDDVTIKRKTGKGETEKNDEQGL